MNLENMRRKLTSRKFWLAVAGLVTSVMLFRGSTQNDTAQVAAIIMGAGSIVTYVFGESLIDSARVGKENESESDTALDPITNE
nr:MAG TPA: holin [Siphoviridae sp. ctYuc6]